MEGSAQVSRPNPDIPEVKLKFQAALNVIKNLPKNGSYKPSPSMMLQFYSYYKQATEGPCRKPKPWAWDVINKAKWDAWSKLGNMSNDEAMEKYVDNLKLVMSEAPPISDEEIVETMPVTENVQEFIRILGDFYETVDLEPPDQFRKFNTPDSTRPQENGTFDPEVHFGEEDQGNDAVHFGDGDDQTQTDEAVSEDEQTSNSSEEEFCDTAEEVEMITASAHNSSTTYRSLQANDQSKSEGLKNFGDHLRNPICKNRSLYTSLPPCTDERSSRLQVEAHQQTQWATSQLQQYQMALNRVSDRLSALETLNDPPRTHRNRASSRDTKDNSLKHMLLKMWPFPGLGLKTVIFIISWPLFIMWIRDVYKKRVKR